MTAPVSNAFIAIGAVMITFGGARAADAFVLLMEVARRGPGPRGVANWQDDRTVLAFLLDVQAAAPIGG